MKTFPIKIYADRIRIEPVAVDCYVPQNEVHLNCVDIKDLFDEVIGGDMQPEVFDYLKENFDAETLRERLGL